LQDGSSSGELYKTPTKMTDHCFGGYRLCRTMAGRLN